MTLALAIFWSCLAILLYVFVGYPLVVRAWSRLAPQRLRRASITPTVTLVVVARDEVRTIARRVHNLLRLDYPADRLEILVGSDGSTDGTASAARSAGAGRVRVLEFRERRGKAAVLNDLVSQARGEILVFGDARQRFARGALRSLVRPFADASVGAASGELVLLDGPARTTVARGVGFYWRYEKFIRRCESVVDSTIGVTGAIYALRRTLFEPIPVDTILDDVLIPMHAARAGYRVVFEPDAIAYDRVAVVAAHELARKVRTIAGNFQLLARERWLLDPLRNRLWFQTISHKALRLALPLLTGALLASNVALVAQPLYALALLGQGGFYGVAAAGRWLELRGARIPGLSVPRVICLLNWATLVGFARFLRGGHGAGWNPTLARGVPATHGRSA
jgi:cellulose synthase/poly-beta-1,6-N-acetylglucosamine synthase-like glycosyltransferase